MYVGGKIPIYLLTGRAIIISEMGSENLGGEVKEILDPLMGMGWNKSLSSDGEW